MKRFLVFSGDHYYPGGGWSDFKGSYDTADEARVAASGTGHEWTQIVDTETGEATFGTAAPPPVRMAGPVIEQLHAEPPLWGTPKPRGMSISEMQRRDAESPHHRAWGGKTSPQVRAEDAELAKQSRRPVGDDPAT